MATKWGILSAGKISNDFVTCLRSIENHEVKVVAAKNVENARKFAELHKIPVVLDNYEDIVKQGVGNGNSLKSRSGKSDGALPQSCDVQKRSTATNRGSSFQMSFIAAL